MTRQDIENRLLENILAVTAGMTVGKRKAARIVGGERNWNGCWSKERSAAQEKEKARAESGALTCPRYCNTAGLHNCHKSQTI